MRSAVETGVAALPELSDLDVEDANARQSYQAEQHAGCFIPLEWKKNLILESTFSTLFASSVYSLRGHSFITAVSLQPPRWNSLPSLPGASGYEPTAGDAARIKSLPLSPQGWRLRALSAAQRRFNLFWGKTRWRRSGGCRERGPEEKDG